jgi:hypothetical protein
MPRLAFSLNAHRRHPTSDEKRDRIAALLKATPETSDRQIAQQVKASPTTVGTVRAKMEAAGGVSKLDTRRDTKGRAQPAKKKRRDVDDFLAEKRAAEAASAHDVAEPERKVPPVETAQSGAREEKLAKEFTSKIALVVDVCERLAGLNIPKLSQDAAREAIKDILQGVGVVENVTRAEADCGDIPHFMDRRPGGGFFGTTITREDVQS